MPFTMTMPKLSPTMEAGTIAKWHKQEGDFVEPGDLLMEVATDKATVEHNALDGGWLRKIIIQEGGEAIVNQAIAIFSEEKDESIEEYQPESSNSEADSQDADSEEQQEEKKESVEKPSVKTSQPGMKQPAFIPEEPLQNYEFAYPYESLSRVKSSPLARKLAKEQSLDLSTVKGSGPGGRVVSADLSKAQPSGPIVFGKREVPSIPPGTYEEEKLSQMRQVIGQRLQEAKTFIPHFYITQAVDVEPMHQIRDQLRQTGIKVSFNDFVMRACALALREHPNINSGFNSVNRTVIRFKTIDISFAVSVDGGLITPIVRHADYKNLGELSVEVRHLAKKARDGKLALEEFKGGSFTVSNLGMYGVTEFQAIINPPQAAILSISGIHNIPVVKEGEVKPGKVMNISLSCDHRVIDGVAGAEFIKTVQKYLENPASLLI
jgi:pyruvate dehydrogenase E2 component (dihydrolipoamide acetyltransferase)